MSRRTAAIAGAVALGMLVSASANAAENGRAASGGKIQLAQAVPEQPPRRTVRTRPRIEIHPGRLLHRECVDGYREVWRPYWGTSVVMPYMRCWWVRG
ncbi:MAG: hypothetical protein E6G88_06920 [Alphaproteobacteria bacterium]|nr:MAG: hypothetical protein E6G88_06920 [Alphaproteobacteria bacterium]